MEFVLLILALLGSLIESAMVHQFLFITHSICMLLISWRMFKRQPLTVLFILAYLAMYFPNPIAILAGWLPMDSKNNVFYLCNSLILIGLDLFVIAALRLRLTSLDANRLPRMLLKSRPVDICILWGIALSGISVVVVIVAADAIGIDPFTIDKSYRVTGKLKYYYLFSIYCFMALPLTVFLIGLKDKIAKVPYVVATIILLMLHLYVFRVRTIPIAVVIAYTVALVARIHFISVGGRPIRGKKPLIMRLMVLLVIPMIISLIIGIKYWRYKYTIALKKGPGVEFSYIIKRTFESDDLGYASLTRRALEIFPKRHTYLLGQSYYRLLFMPIPRTLWPGKPPNTQRIFAALLDPELGRKGVTIPPGIVGDLYINFGKFGVLGMIVFGVFFAQERYRGLTDLFFLAGSGYWIFHLCRGSLTNPVLTLIIIWLLSILLTRIIRPSLLNQLPNDSPQAKRYIGIQSYESGKI